MLKKVNKSNILLLASIAIFIFSGFHFISLNIANGALDSGMVSGGKQVGGRVIGPIFIAGSCGCPGATIPACPHLCMCGTQDTPITPFGWSGTYLCTSPAMPTNGPPLGPQSVGNQILGLFMAGAGINTPLGIIGTSL
jgi:hypothetical protein